MPTTKLYPSILNLIEELKQEWDLIPEARKNLLQQMAQYLDAKNSTAQAIQLNFICTHNSRRSHISQIWSATAAYYYGLKEAQHFSGGTEATAFNPRAIAAMRRAGFQIEAPEAVNPHCKVSFANDAAPIVCFSKTFDDPFNPVKGFAAIMTCSDADQNCPFVPGAEKRFALTYEDPKVADDTPAEEAKYDERVRQIGREILYWYSWVQ